MTAIPPYLRPGATHLPEGHDDTLDPSEAPTDALERSAAPTEWPSHNLAKGSADPPDAPLAPPPTDPAARGLPPFEWPTGPACNIANRPLAETVSPLDTLDPDIALWQKVEVSIWPFAGPPQVGIWPRGWLGIDNLSTIWVCTIGGQPGTWIQVPAGSSAGVASFNGRTGAVVPGPADYLAVQNGGLPGATNATRYVGGTVSGAPTTGAFNVGDYVIAQNGGMFVCTIAGSPGTWIAVGLAGAPAGKLYATAGAFSTTLGNPMTGATSQYMNGGCSINGLGIQVPFAGIYHASFQMWGTMAVGSGSLATCYLGVNGVALETGSNLFFNSGSGCSYAFSADVQLNANDVVTTFTANGASNATMLNPNNQNYNYLTLHLVSR